MSHCNTSNSHVNKNIVNQPTSESTHKEESFIEPHPSVHLKKYVKIPNELVDDLNLSIQAKWLLVYLLRQAPGWVFYQAVILKHMGYGREKVEQLFSELRRAGYVSYTILKDEKGQIIGKRRHFAREPVYLQNRTTEKPCPGKPVDNKNTMATSKKTISNNNSNNSRITTPPAAPVTKKPSVGNNYSEAKIKRNLMAMKKAGEIAKDTEIEQKTQEVLFHIQHRNTSLTPTEEHAYRAAIKLLKAGKWTPPLGMLSEEITAREEAAAKEKREEIAQTKGKFAELVGQSIQQMTPAYAANTAEYLAKIRSLTAIAVIESRNNPRRHYG